MIDPAHMTQLIADHQAEIAELSRHLERDIELLNAAAKGDRDQEEEPFYENVTDAYMRVIELLFKSPVESEVPIHDGFWGTELGQMLQNAMLWINCDKLITITEAAEMLRGSSEVRDLVYVKSLIKRGALVRYVDMTEPNPQRRGRVSRGEVELILIEEEKKRKRKI